MRQSRGLTQDNPAETESCSTWHNSSIENCHTKVRLNVLPVIRDLVCILSAVDQHNLSDFNFIPLLQLSFFIGLHSQSVLVSPICRI